jgi:hypothetical protein
VYVWFREREREGQREGEGERENVRVVGRIEDVGDMQAFAVGASERRPKRKTQLFGAISERYVW